MPVADTNSYKKPSRLMNNYGWVQNTSNLSTVRDTVELVPIGGISHNELMLRIHDFRVANGDIKSKWTWAIFAFPAPLGGECRPYLDVIT